MNSVANGKVLSLSKYKNVFIPPQPGDAGGALGAAAYSYVMKSKKPMNFDPMQAYKGPSYEMIALEAKLRTKFLTLKIFLLKKLMIGLIFVR